MGQDHRRPICSFGEKVAYQRPRRFDKSAPSWDYGVWIGKCTSTEEHLIGTKDGVVRARSIRRLPASDRFDKELYENFKGVPWRPRGPGTENIPDFVVGPSPMPSRSHDDDDKDDIGQGGG